MDTAVVTTKGQVVIPARIRRKMGIKQGTRVVFDEKNNTIVLRPITEAYIDSFRGILKTKLGEKPMTQELVEDHAAEVAQEEAKFEKRGF